MNFILLNLGFIFYLNIELYPGTQLSYLEGIWSFETHFQVFRWDQTTFRLRPIFPITGAGSEVPPVILSKRDMIGFLYLRKLLQEHVEDSRGKAGEGRERPKAEAASVWQGSNKKMSSGSKLHTGIRKVRVGIDGASCEHSKLRRTSLKWRRFPIWASVNKEWDPCETTEVVRGREFQSPSETLCHEPDG